MKYYKYKTDADRFAGIGLGRDDDARVTEVYYQDRNLSTTWRPIRCFRFEDGPLEEGDFPSLSNFNRLPIFSERAWDVLRPCIGYCCEALPITLPSASAYYIVHVMDTFACVNMKDSEVKRYSDGGIMKIIRYSLNMSSINGKTIFKLPHDMGGELLVSEGFRQLVEMNGLKGLVFDEIPLVGGV